MNALRGLLDMLHRSKQVSHIRFQMVDGSFSSIAAHKVKLDEESGRLMVEPMRVS